MNSKEKKQQETSLYNKHEQLSKEFYKRLHMLSDGDTQEKIAEALGTTQGRISNIKQGKATFNIDDLLAAAEKYNCSTDYLLGLSSEKGTCGKNKEGAGAYARPLSIRDFLYVIDCLYNSGIVDVINIDESDIKRIYHGSLSNPNNQPSRYRFSNNQQKEYYGVAIIPFNLNYRGGLDDKNTNTLADAIKQYIHIKEIWGRDIGSGKSIFKAWLEDKRFDKSAYSFTDYSALYFESAQETLFWDSESHSYYDSLTDILYDVTPDFEYKPKSADYCDSIDDKKLFFGLDSKVLDETGMEYILDKQINKYVPVDTRRDSDLLTDIRGRGYKWDEGTNRYISNS